MILITDYLHLKSIGIFFFLRFEISKLKLTVWTFSSDLPKNRLKTLQFPKQLRGLAAQENKKTHLTDSFCSGHYKG